MLANLNSEVDATLAVFLELNQGCLVYVITQQLSQNNVCEKS